MLEARGAIYMWSTDAEQEAALRIGDSLRELQEDEDEYHEISGFDLSEISFAESPINEWCEYCKILCYYKKKRKI